MNAIYKFTDENVKDDSGVIVMSECPVVTLKKALVFEDIEIKRNKDGFSHIKAVLSEVDKVDADNDKIMPGAFDKSIEELDHMVMLKMHQRDQIVGRWDNLHMDGKLLKADGIIYDGDKGYDIARMTRFLIDTGDMSGVSIGFRLKVWQTVRDEEGGRPYGWDIYDLELMEASIVDRPANDSAQVTDIKAELQKQIMSAVHSRPDPFLQSYEKVFGKL